MTRDVAIVIGELLEDLNDSAACCSGMISLRPDHHWLLLRDMFHATKAMIVSEIVDPMMANSGAQNGR